MLKSNFGWRLAAVMSTVGMLAMAGPALSQDNSKNVTIVLAEEPPDLDSCNSGGEYTGAVLGQNVVETLTLLNPADGSILPHLADSWEQINDKTWRFKLHQGVTYHDGTPFNAAALTSALHRYETLEDNGVVCFGFNKLGSVRLTINAVDDYTVDITPSKVIVPLPTYMSLMPIGLPGQDDKKLVREGAIGTGPYKFQSWTAREKIIVARNDAYWGDKVAPDTVTYVWRKEPALRAAMVEAGEADIAFPIAPADATNPDTDYGYLNGETSRARFILQPPLDDVRVRRALNLAIDRNAPIGTILDKNVKPATQLMLPKINGYNPNLKVWPYDPAAAKKLIDEARAAGVPVDNELRLVFYPTNFENIGELAEVLAQNWTAIGLKIRLDSIDRAQYLKLANKPYDRDRPAMIVLEQHDNNNGDAVFTVPFKFHSKGNHSETYLPELDKMIDEAGISVGDKRRQLYQEIGRILYEDLTVDAPLYHMVAFMRISKRLDFKPPALYSGARFNVSGIKFAS